MRCGYCGRFMHRLSDDELWEANDGADEWVCSRQAQHILSDPGHWSVYVENVVLDGDAEPYTGSIGAHNLTEAQLREVLGLTPQPSDSSPEGRHETMTTERGE